MLIIEIIKCYENGNDMKTAINFIMCVIQALNNQNTLIQQSHITHTLLPQKIFTNSDLFLTLFINTTINAYE